MYNKNYFNKKEIMQPDKSLNFNKDLLILQEIQRLETYSNNFELENMPEKRYTCLKQISIIICPLFSKSEDATYRDLKRRALIRRRDNISGQFMETYNPQVLDELDEFLHKMLIDKGFHLNKADSDIDATD